MVPASVPIGGTPSHVYEKALRCICNVNVS